MKYTGFILAVCFFAGTLNARPIGRPVEFQRPTTTTAVVKPATTVPTFRPVTASTVSHPVTQTSIGHPQTNVAVVHPTTQVQVLHPQTTVNTVRPQTTVVVFQPQTTVEVIHPQTIETSSINGEGENANNSGKGSSMRTATTSMSDFKPMQAKDLATKKPMDKAHPMGGGNLDLGDGTNQAEKDRVAQSSKLKEQLVSSQNLEIDPNKKAVDLGGLEKLISDKAKKEEKK